MTVLERSDSACITLNDQQIFFETHGSGVIYLRRGTEITKLSLMDFVQKVVWEGRCLYCNHWCISRAYRRWWRTQVLFRHYRPEEVVECAYDEEQTYGFGTSFEKRTLVPDLPVTGWMKSSQRPKQKKDLKCTSQYQNRVIKETSSPHRPSWNRIRILLRSFVHGARLHLRPSRYWLFILSRHYFAYL
jgi:hypothetical protein